MYLEISNPTGLPAEADFERIYQWVKMERNSLEEKLKELEAQRESPVSTEDRARELVQQFLDSSYTSRELGDEFLIDFMGDVYRGIGIDYGKIEKLFADCLDFCKDEKLFKSSYAEMIENDAKHLLALCNLPTNLPVWEIQIEEEILLLLLGDSNKPLGRYEKDGTFVNVYQVAEKPCKGLVSAAFYAKRSRVSLANVLIKVQGERT